VELDLNNTPDALPAMAVTACAAKGTTRILNVAHARIKETDRLQVMTEELRRMGARIQEMEDGLIIEQSRLKGCPVRGHHDHRVVMSLSLAGMMAEGITQIDTAESIRVTFPDYIALMQNLGGRMEMAAAAGEEI
jgi:3-phosphoshikimate 1-carboxyvinyltransferase